MEIFESLLAGLRTVCADFPDARRSPDPELDYSMADIGLSAFSLFFMQSESFLSYQRRLEKGHGTSNCHSLFGMNKIPTDTYIRWEMACISARGSCAGTCVGAGVGAAPDCGSTGY